MVCNFCRFGLPGITTFIPVASYGFVQLASGFLSAFCPTEVGMRLYGLLGVGGGGASMYSCAKHVAN